MRFLVTGATGFVGPWLVRELEQAGHEVVAAPSSAVLDVADRGAVERLVTAARPDAIAHLAAGAATGDTTRDPLRAIRTQVGGTLAITQAAAMAQSTPGLLLVSSAEVYAEPVAGDRALVETSALGPRTPYAMLKLAQEAIALSAGAREGLSVVVARPFNHVGPGQRPVSAVASFAERITAVRRGETDVVSVGNLDVERDIADVRDVAAAYGLLLRALASGELGQPPSIFNVATGRGVRLRSVLDQLCRIAGTSPEIRVDPGLVRADEPTRIVGDASALRAAVGWRPRISLEQTLVDVLEAIRGG